MLGDEFQNVAVEGFGLFPVDRVRGFGQYDELGAGDTSELGELKGAGYFSGGLLVTPPAP